MPRVSMPSSPLASLPTDRPSVVTGVASLFAGDLSGMVPEPTGTTAAATNGGYATLFTYLGLGSVVAGLLLGLLVPTLRRLIRDRGEQDAPLGQPQ